MPYRIVARRVGETSTFQAPTEQDALASANDLRSQGLTLAIFDAETGEAISEEEIGERIDSRSVRADD